MEEHEEQTESMDPRASQLASQIILLLLGFLSLFWLLNIFAFGGNILPDVTEVLTPTVWGIIAVVLLSLVFIGEMVLLFFRPS